MVITAVPCTTPGAAFHPMPASVSLFMDDIRPAAATLLKPTEQVAARTLTTAAATTLVLAHARSSDAHESTSAPAGCHDEAYVCSTVRS